MCFCEIGVRMSDLRRQRSRVWSLEGHLIMAKRNKIIDYIHPFIHMYNRNLLFVVKCCFKFLMNLTEFFNCSDSPYV